MKLNTYYIFHEVQTYWIIHDYQVIVQSLVEYYNSSFKLK